MKRLLLFFVLISTPTLAEMSGHVAIDSRFFLQGPLYQGQEMNNAPSLVLEPEFYTQDGPDTWTLRLFGRLDPYDPNRTHIDVRQADWLTAGEGWEFSMGVSKVFWGVTESRHLVDIINQTDAIEDTDGEDKLGQPMIQLGFFRDWGNIRLFYLPYFRERTFTQTEGRLRGPSLVNTDKAVYESRHERWHPDIALRYNHYIGNWDFGLSHFHGTSRDPRLIRSGNTLTPYYDLIDQTGLDLQYTNEGWLWKLEAITVDQNDTRFEALSGGLEYTFYNIDNADTDVGLIVEYHRDTRDDKAPATLFDRDMFVGTRITLNDVDSTEFLGGIMWDRNNDSLLYSIEASKRIGNNWKIELETRLFSNTNKNDNAYILRGDDHMTLRLSRFF